MRHKKFWAEAVNTAAYTLNRTDASPIKELIPYEAYFKKTSPVEFFREFGLEVSVHISKEKRLKWDPKNINGFCVGYGEEVKGEFIFQKETK